MIPRNNLEVACFTSLSFDPLWINTTRFHINALKWPLLTINKSDLKRFAAKNIRCIMLNQKFFVRRCCILTSICQFPLDLGLTMGINSPWIHDLVWFVLKVVLSPLSFPLLLAGHWLVCWHTFFFSQMNRKEVSIDKIYDARALRVIVGDRNGTLHGQAVQCCYNFLNIIHRLQ